MKRLLKGDDFRKSYPNAPDRSTGGGARPEPAFLSFMARLRPEGDDGTSQDEGVPNKFAGHRGVGELMKVGVGNPQRIICDGQSLASPGR